MDRKSIIVLIVCFVLLFLWYPLVNYLYPPTPIPQTTNVVDRAVTPPGVATNIVQQPGAPVIPPPATVPAPTPFEPDQPEQTLTVESPEARYIFSSLGGGLKKIELKHYEATVVCDKGQEQVAVTNRATLNAPAPVPALTILADGWVQGGFTLTNIDNGVRAVQTLPSGLRVIKDYQLGTNFLLKATVRILNSTGQPIQLPAQEWVIGTATPIGQRDESLHMGLQWYDGDSAHTVDEAWFQNRTLGCFPGTPRAQYVAGASNVVWSAVHNQFFAMVAIPSQPAPGFVGRRIPLPPPTPEQIAADPEVFATPVGFQGAFLYPGTVLQPGETLERQFDIYAGPKEYNTLARLGHQLDLVMKFGFFGFFAKALLLSMNGLHALGLTYGIAIVVITIIIKLLFWPLTNASTRSMKRMAALQPQMKAIQEKYKDDPRKMNMKLMEFMKEHRVSPLGGCLPMLLQIPVFIGFYTMLQSAIELRGAEFLWACDLSRADTIWVVPGIGFPINPMPLLMGLTMLWQARLTPPAPGMDPIQQKIMRYMPLIFMVFLYNFSAGLTLYWTVQNLLTIAQMKLTKTSEPQAPGGTPATAPAIKPPGQKKKKS